jgi:hypothetical protein
MVWQQLSSCIILSQGLVEKIMIHSSSFDSIVNILTTTNCYRGIYESCQLCI